MSDHEAGTQPPSASHAARHSSRATRHSRIISFLTDFGLQDVYVGVVKAVMLERVGEVAIVDLTHEVTAQDVFEGAFQLMTAVGYFPSGTVHLAVVDPGVGTSRRAVAVGLAGHCFVGPDNGLLSLALQRLAAERQLALHVQEGSLLVVPPLEAVELTEPRFWRHPVSSTFHARDVFGPVAAHLAAGVPLRELGQSVDRLVSLPFPAPQRLSSQRLLGQIIHIDRFGNLVTNLPRDLVPANAQVRVGHAVLPGLQVTYGAGAGPVALIGSAGYLELAVPGGSAAQQLGLRRGDPVEVVVSG